MIVKSDKIYAKVYGATLPVYQLEECYILKSSTDYSYEEWGFFADHNSAVDAMHSISQLHVRLGNLEARFTLSFAIVEIKTGILGVSKFGARWFYREGQEYFLPAGWFDAPYVSGQVERLAFRPGEKVCFCHEEKLYQGSIKEVPPDESQAQEWPAEARTNENLNRYVVDAPETGAVELLEYELIRCDALPEWVRF